MNHTDLTPELIRQAKDWIADCEWADILCQSDIDSLRPESVFASVQKHYSGGWEQFIKDGEGESMARHTLGEIWREERVWKIQMPRGVHTTKTRREAQLFSDSVTIPDWKFPVRSHGE